MKNERAYYATVDLLTYHDAERTAFDIINRYLRFVDKEDGKQRTKCRLNEQWAYFIGSDRGRLKLTTKPEPYTFERTMHWLYRQVAPTLKVAIKLDEINDTKIIDTMIEQAKLSERHEKILQQQAAGIVDLIITENGGMKNEFWAEFVSMVFEQCTIPCVDGGCGYWYLLRFQA